MSACVVQKTSTSSMWQRIPFWPARIFSIWRWKCSGALEMPNGILLKWYLPNGVIKVVNSLPAESAKTRCLRRVWLNTFALSCACVMSTFDRGCVSRRTLSLILRKSTQMRTAPDFWGTTTMPKHQGVGLSVREITPMDSIRPSSSCTFSLSGIGMARGVNKAKGVLSGVSCILKLSGNDSLPQREHFELSEEPFFHGLWCGGPLFLCVNLYWTLSTDSSCFGGALSNCCCSCTASRWNVIVLRLLRSAWGPAASALITTGFPPQCNHVSFPF